MQASIDHSAELAYSHAFAFAARNLRLLGEIESTLNALKADIGLVKSITEGYDEIEQKLASRETLIDPEGRLQGLITKASDTCVRIYSDLKRRHAAACIDPQLRPDDGVAEAYDEYLSAVEALHDRLEEFREWVAIHDAILQPSTGAVYSTVDDLFDALLK